MSQTYPQFPDTTFPDAVQVLSRYLDITQNDLSKYNSYIEYITQGNLNAAQNVLATIDDYANKTITAEKLNKITDTVMAGQTLYTGSEWQSKVQDKQNEWLAIINQFNYLGNWNVLGNWSNTTHYSTGDIVLYNGKIWQAISDGVGQTPNDNSIYWTQTYKKNTMVGYAATVQAADPTLYLYIATQDISISTSPYADYLNSIQNNITPQWFRLTMRGVRGNPGIGMNFGFDWNKDTLYDANTIVVHNNQWWSCTEQNQNNEPSVTSPFWQLELSVNTAKIPIQTNQPTASAQQIGDVWFQIV